MLLPAWPLGKARAVRRDRVEVEGRARCGRSAASARRPCSRSPSTVAAKDAGAPALAAPREPRRDAKPAAERAIGAAGLGDGDRRQVSPGDRRAIACELVDQRDVGREVDPADDPAQRGTGQQERRSSAARARVIFRHAALNEVLPLWASRRAMDESSNTQNRRSRRSHLLMTATLEVSGRAVKVKLRNLSAEGAQVEGDELAGRRHRPAVPQGRPGGGRVDHLDQGQAGRDPLRRRARPGDGAQSCPGAAPAQEPTISAAPGSASRALTEQERTLAETWIAVGPVPTVGD